MSPAGSYYYNMINNNWKEIASCIAFNIGRNIRFHHDIAPILLVLASDDIKTKAINEIIKPRLEKDDRSWLKEDFDFYLSHSNQNSNDSLLYDCAAQLIREERKEIAWALTKYLLVNTPERQLKDCEFPETVHEIQKLFKLSDKEVRLLIVLYIINSQENIDNFIRSYEGSEINSAISNAAGLTVQDFTSLAGEGSNLHQLGFLDFIINSDNFRDIHLLSKILFTFNTGSIEVLSQGLFSEIKLPEIDLESFPVPENELTFISSLLNAGKSVLITGTPGIGKTAFTASLAKSLGKTLRILNSADSQAGNNRTGANRTRLKLINLASKFIDSSRELLLIDEADAILQGATGFFSLFSSESYDKGEINFMLENLKIPAVWIANSVSMMPDSTLRRFAYVYKFPSPDFKLRKKMLVDKLNCENIGITDEFAQTITKKYELTPSAIERLASAVKASAASELDDRKKIETLSSAYISSMSKGLASNDFRKKVSMPDNFNPELCQSSIPASELKELLASRIDKHKSTRLIFSGLPGGGKTQFAFYLSHVLDLEAMLKKPSDILSKWVGEAEQNIAEMFRQAEERKALLIIDEADSFLMDRSNLSRSWEMSQAAEWLQGIQEYSGTLIACTNRFDSIDPALRRRFHRHVEFNNLQGVMIEKAVKHFFPDTYFADLDFTELFNASSVMISDIATAAEMIDISAKPDMIVNEILANAHARRSEKRIGFNV